MSIGEILHRLLTFQGTGQLLRLDFVQQALIAGALLALIAGALGPLIVARQVSFAVHGTSELTFTGAAAALLVSSSLVSVGALVGAVVAALVFGLLGLRERERDSVIGAVLAFGLGLGGLFLWLYPGRASNQLSLLFGQIVAVSRNDAWLLGGCAAGVLLVLAVVWRPLLFASMDADVARARGVPVRGMSVLFAVLVGVATGLAVPTVGALLVLSLLITPAAAAARVTANPVTALLLATLFAEVAVLGGIVASLAPGAPISGYVTAIAFAIYLICRAMGALRPCLRSGSVGNKNARNPDINSADTSDLAECRARPPRRRAYALRHQIGSAAPTAARWSRRSGTEERSTPARTSRSGGRGRHGTD